MKKPIRIALVGDFNSQVVAHQAIPKALQLSARRVGRPVESAWCATESLEDSADKQLADFDGIWCVPASPYRSMTGALGAIRFARESARPFLGTCGGFQHVLIEFARNVLHLAEADHAESNPNASMQLVAPLACAMVERMGSVRFKPGSRIAAIYNSSSAVEGYHCSYGLNERFAQILEKSDLQITATDIMGSARAVELAGHPFFIATLFQPERSAVYAKENPLITAFLKAASATQ